MLAKKILKGGIFMNDKNRNLPYGCPSDYFQNLAENLLEGVKAANSNIEEVSDIVTQLPKGNPFELPQNYFDTVSIDFFDSLQSIESLENRIPRNSEPFTVPVGYFENFAQNMHSLIQDSDTDLVDNYLVEMVGKDNVYQIPETYFQDFKVPISNSQIENDPSPLVISKVSKNKWTNWIAAASILFIFTLGGVWMMGSQNSDSPNSNNFNSAQLASLTLSNVSDEDIDAYMEEDIENFDVYSLMDNANITNVNNISNGYLDNISKEDIEAYLEYEGI